MRVEVLISCMFQDVRALIVRENIQSDVLVINQCDEDREEEYSLVNKKGETCTARIIYTTERGLSRSRNMAMKNARGEICLFCDDDEVFENDYVEKVIKAFDNNPQYDIITFRLRHPTCVFSDKSYRIRIFQSGRIKSIQIGFRNIHTVTSIHFCEKIGSGTGNGGGEENKFIVDNLRQGVKIRYEPLLIVSVAQTESQWFHGYNKQYWINRGWSAKMVYGYLLGYIFVWYTLIMRCHKVDKKNSWYKHFLWMHRGFLKRL